MEPAFQDEAPLEERITTYDERHFVTYLRLLDAHNEGADWQEAVTLIFGLDPQKEPERAHRVHDSHLKRALWMSNTGYRHLLERRP